MTRTAIVNDPVYLRHDTGSHPESAERLTAIAEGLQADGLADKLGYIVPEHATQEDLLRVHNKSMIDHIQEVCQSGGGYLDGDTIASTDSWEAALAAAGGIITGLEAIMVGEFDRVFCAVRPPGHHATPTHPMGFCLFNNIAIGAQFLLQVCELSRILIIDFDVHHGNGTQDAFYDNDKVYFFSLHQYPLYPMSGMAEERGKGNGKHRTLNCPLPPNTTAADYMQVFPSALSAIEQEFEPEFILVSAGFDAHRDDPLANLQLTENDYAEITRRIVEFGKTKKVKGILSTLEGGYNLSALSASVNAHVRSLLKG